MYITLYRSDILNRYYTTSHSIMLYYIILTYYMIWYYFYYNITYSFISTIYQMGAKYFLFDYCLSRLTILDYDSIITTISILPTNYDFNSTI